MLVHRDTVGVTLEHRGQSSQSLEKMLLEWSVRPQVRAF